MKNKGIKRADLICIAVMLLLYGIYYGYLMYESIPNSDEIGMYIWFSHKGLLFSITQWVAPGNHILYLAASSIVDAITGSALWGMRGASWSVALINLVFFYYLIRKYISDQWLVAMAGASLYGSNYGVMDYAVRGRGYTFCNLFFLFSIDCLMKLLDRDQSEKDKKKTYLSLAISFLLGLYTVPTFLYCIFPIVLYLLVDMTRKKRWREIKLLLFCGIGVGVCILILYLPIWICLGIRSMEPELTKLSINKDSIMIAVNIVRSAPVKVILNGFEFFWRETTKYTGSIALEEVWGGLADKIKDIIIFITPGKGIIVGIVGIILAIYGLCRIGMLRGGEKQRYLAQLSVLSLVVFIPLMLLQRVLPFTRVYLYLAVPVAIGWVFILNSLIGRASVLVGRIAGAILLMVSGIILPVWTGKCVIEEKSEWDSIYNACRGLPWLEIKSVLPCGTYQEEYVKYFEILEHIEDIETDRVSPDVVLLGSNGWWNDKITYEELPWDYIDMEMEIYYRDAEIIGYIRSQP